MFYGQEFTGCMNAQDGTNGEGEGGQHHKASERWRTLSGPENLKEQI